MSGCHTPFQNMNKEPIETVPSIGMNLYKEVFITIQCDIENLKIHKSYQVLLNMEILDKIKILEEKVKHLSSLHDMINAKEKV